MKRVFIFMLIMLMNVSYIPECYAQTEDLTKSLSTGEYGGEGTWWDHSDAQVTEEQDFLIIKNIDDNASYSAVDVADSILGDEYSDYTEEDYANEYDESVAAAHKNQPIQTKIYDKLRENNPENKQNTVRTKGKTNHGLFSNRIAISGQSVRIRFSAQFIENGAFVEISNNTGYGPYINTDNGTITVNTGYENSVLLSDMKNDEWYTFDVVLHDGRDDNPVSSGTVTLYDENENVLGVVDNLRLHYDKADWYKINFFPNSRNGAEMYLKELTVSEADNTPVATQKPEKTPYPTLDPTPSPSPLPEDHETPMPTLCPVTMEGEDIYTMHEDFGEEIKNVGNAPKTSNITIPSNAAANAIIERDNSTYMTITNTGSGTRYISTNDENTRLISTSAVTEIGFTFNKLSAHTGEEAAVIDLTSSSADNKKTDDTNLLIAAKISVNVKGEVMIGDKYIGTVSIGSRYVLRIESENSQNNVFLYDENGLLGSVLGNDFYDAAANGVKNIRFDIKRGGTSLSISDIYMYENKVGGFNDVSGIYEPMIGYLKSVGIAEPFGTKITAIYDKNNVLKRVYTASDDTISLGAEDRVKHFRWDSITDMKPIAEGSFCGNEAITADDANKMTAMAAEIKCNIEGDVTREKFYSALVDVYKKRSGDSEPISSELKFDDSSEIEDKTTIGIATAIGITPVTIGYFKPTSVVTRYEAAQAMLRLIAAINVGITDRDSYEAEEDAVIPHVIDQLPDTGILRDPMVLNAPDGYYYMCCSTGTSPEDAKNGFPNANINNESLWKDDTGIRVWRSSDLIDWEPVRAAKEDSEYPDYIWNIYEGGTWEKVNGFGFWNINVDGTNGSLGAKRFAQVLWAPEIHWAKGTYFIVYCINPGGIGIARSVSGKVEGPYVRQETCQDAPFRGGRIDASMFWDDDNTVYYTDGSCAIYRMNGDITTYDKFIGKQAPGKEGGYLFKHNGIYYATAGEFDDNGGYDSVIGMNKTGNCLANGSYGEIHWLYTLGHNGYFEDKQGQWWATMFGNDNDKLANETNGFNNGFALVPIDFDKHNGSVFIDTDRLEEWNNTLQEHGYRFAK